MEVDVPAMIIVLDATAPRARRIWSLRHGMTAYDAGHAAAAEALEAPLVTVDRRLLRACADASIRAVHLDDLDSGEERCP